MSTMKKGMAFEKAKIPLLIFFCGYSHYHSHGGPRGGVAAFRPL